MNGQPQPTEPEKANILLVDDTPANLRLLTSILGSEGYKVRSVVNGQMALTAAQSAPPDLILLDITMPEMDGYEVCRRLKANPVTSEVPVLFISALDVVDDKLKAFSVGGVDYITKPFQIQEVLARVRTHLALREMQRRLQHVNQELESMNTVLEERVRARTAELLRLNKSLEHFVPREFVTYLDKPSITELSLGDSTEREMTVMFSDIRGFTTRSEQMSPQDTFNFLNEYFSYVGPVIHKHGGFIDKYLGDGLMALFPNQPGDAIQAAIEMQQAVSTFNQALEQSGRETVRIGIGLNTGRLMVGILGESRRVQGTVISDAVNLAQRMDALTKHYRTYTVLSESTFERLPTGHTFNLRFLDRVQVKGRQEVLAIYEVVDGESEPARSLITQTKPLFEEGLALYQERKFAEASVCFNQVLRVYPEDRPAQLYLKRAAHFMVHGVPANWQGVEVITEEE